MRKGHREISEYYYRTADKLAGRIAATYLGKQFTITGSDLQAELGKSARANREPIFPMNTTSNWIPSRRTTAI